MFEATRGGIPVARGKKPLRLPHLLLSGRAFQKNTRIQRASRKFLVWTQESRKQKQTTCKYHCGTPSHTPSHGRHAISAMRHESRELLRRRHVGVQFCRGESLLRFMAAAPARQLHELAI